MPQPQDPRKLDILKEHTVSNTSRSFHSYTHVTLLYNSTPNMSEKPTADKVRRYPAFSSPQTLTDAASREPNHGARARL
jgi:hypothetical protein